MAGKQVAICLRGEDSQALATLVLRGERFRVLESVWPSSTPVEAKGPLGALSGQCYLVREADLDKLVVSPLGDGRHSVDRFSLPVIEHSPTINKDASIRAGRFYFQPTFDEGDALITKPGDFLEWADWVLQTCRSKLWPDKQTRVRWGEEARRERDAGRIRAIDVLGRPL